MPVLVKHSLASSACATLVRLNHAGHGNAFSIGDIAYAQQDGLIQTAVMGHYPREIAGDVAKLILKRMVN